MKQRGICIVVGETGAGHTMAVAAAKMMHEPFGVTVVSNEKVDAFSNREPLPIRNIRVNQPYTPPETRQQRRKRERNKK